MLKWSPTRGATWYGFNLVPKYFTKVEVTHSEENFSLLQCIINYGCKRFMVQAGSAISTGGNLKVVWAEFSTLR